MSDIPDGQTQVKTAHQDLHSEQGALRVSRHYAAVRCIRAVG